MELRDSKSYKVLKSKRYNFIFRKKDGLFIRWGTTEEENPQCSPFGPEIADIEISKDGCPNACPYCYKSNTNDSPFNMSIETFKIILGKLGPQLTQVALGITGVRANPDFIPIMQACRDKGVIPNFTMADDDLDTAMALEIGKLAGAVAVSYKKSSLTCFHTMEKLTMAGVKQVNIHAVTTNYDHIASLMWSIKKYREEKNDLTTPSPFQLNALVLLSLKPKGRAMGMRNISDEELGYLVGLSKDLDIPLGFDSCSASKVMGFYTTKQQSLIEPCESGLFSIYIDVSGIVHPCSFMEGAEVFPNNLDVTKCDFINDIWLGSAMVEWRKKLIDNKRKCLVYK
jgi:MoaA/NifB/PqqE/SkfB family radical SAM enzyme